MPGLPDLTLYFLQASRSIRIAWLLEELDLEYKLETYDREDTGLAPAVFKQSCGTELGKAPVLKDGRLTLQESGAITEYVFPIPTLISTLLIAAPFDHACQVSLRALRHVSPPSPCRRGPTCQSARMDPCGRRYLHGPLPPNGVCPTN